MTDWRFILNKQMKHPWPSKYHPEPQVWKVISKIHGLNFIDVGAHLGQVYSFPLHTHFSRTYALEPNPQYAQRMRSEIRRKRILNDEWGAIEVCEWAASNQNEITDLWIGSDGIGVIENGSETFQKDVISQNKKILSKVSTRRLDDWWGETEVTLLKMDVEGAEFKALEGAERTLELTKNLLVELHFPERGQDLYNIFLDSGFRSRWVDETHLFGSRM